MIDVWKQLESRPDDAEGGKALKYSLDNLEYGIDVNDGHCTRERTVHCYELKNEKNGYLVVDVYGLMCETQSGTYNLSGLLTDCTGYTPSCIVQSGLCVIECAHLNRKET